MPFPPLDLSLLLSSSHLYTCSTSCHQRPSPQRLETGQLPPDDIALRSGHQVCLCNSRVVQRSRWRVPFSFVSPSHRRFGDPVTLNCSVHQMNFQILGWDVSPVTKSREKERPDFVAPIEFKGPPDPTVEQFLVWNVERMTEWDINLTCFALSDQWGQCYLKLPVLVYSELRHAGKGLGSRPCGSSADLFSQSLQRPSPSAS